MTKFIAVVSGKGGVGKTTVSINLAHSLTVQGVHTLVLDGNVMTPHVGLHLGIMEPSATVNDYLQQKSDLWSMVTHHPSGVDFLLASPSYQEGKVVQVKQLGKVLGHLENRYDIVLVDCPSGLGYEVGTLIKYCDEVLIVTQPHLASVMDALKVAQVTREENTLITGILLNMCYGKKELSAGEVEEMTGLAVIGSIPYDEKIRKALYEQDIASAVYPRSAAAKQFREFAALLLGKPIRL